MRITADQMRKQPPVRSKLNAYDRYVLKIEGEIEAARRTGWVAVYGIPNSFHEKLIAELTENGFKAVSSKRYPNTLSIKW